MAGRMMEGHWYETELTQLDMEGKGEWKLFTFFLINSYFYRREENAECYQSCENAECYQICKGKNIKSSKASGNI